MRLLGYAAGGALVVAGLGGLVAEGVLFGWALWFGGVLVVHDALLAPAVAVAGTVAGRWPWPVRTALILAGTLIVATLPTVLALGRRADNPSILPLSYGVNLLVVLAAIALVALVEQLVRKGHAAVPDHRQGAGAGEGQDPADPAVQPGPGRGARRGRAP